MTCVLNSAQQQPVSPQVSAMQGQAVQQEQAAVKPLGPAQVRLGLQMQQHSDGAYCSSHKLGPNTVVLVTVASLLCCNTNHYLLCARHIVLVHHCSSNIFRLLFAQCICRNGYCITFAALHVGTLCAAT